MLKGTIVAMLVTCGMSTGLVFAGGDWKGDLEAAIRTKYKITKTGFGDRLRITEPGTVFVLKQEGVRADLATDLTLYANKVDVHRENAGVAQASGLLVSLGNKETSRALPVGEELYLYDVDVSDKEVKYQLITTKTYQVTVKGSTKEMRYKALLVFQFGNAELAPMTADDIGQATSTVLATRDEVATQANQSKTVSLGQTPAQVEAVLGKPETILNLGQKVTYVYKNLRVVFVDGRVADVQ